MRRFALAAVSLVATCAAATAADLSRPPVIQAPQPYAGWSGFYLGLNVGGAIGNGRSDFSVGGVTFATVNNSLPGAIGGGQAGYNWQTGMTVFGVETDFQAANLKGTLTAPCAFVCGLPLTATYSQKVPWFGTVRGRVGYATPGWFAYGTAGFAYDASTPRHRPLRAA